MLVDKFTWKKKRWPEYVLETFYGCLEHIFLIKLHPECLDNTHFSTNEPIILAAIRSCKLETTPAELETLDIHLYSHEGSLDFINVTSIQALVSRVPCSITGLKWAVVDRSIDCPQSGSADLGPGFEQDQTEGPRVQVSLKVDQTLLNRFRSRLWSDQTSGLNWGWT